MDNLENYLHALDGQDKELIVTWDLNCNLSLCNLIHVGIWTPLTVSNEASDR